MADLAYLTANLFNRVAFPDHVITANENSDDAFRVGRGDRSGINALQASTANQDFWVEADFGGVIRAFNFLAIERGSNVFGKTVRLEASDDNFTTDVDAVSRTLPAASERTTATPLESGAVTTDGAYVLRFDVHASAYVRLFVPAVSSFRPKITGLYVGLLWEPDMIGLSPYHDQTSQGSWQESVSPAGWRSRGTVAQPRVATDDIQLLSHFEGDVAEQALAHARRGSATWRIPDTAQADRAALVTLQQGEVGFAFERGPAPWRQGGLSWIEHQPELL